MARNVYTVTQVNNYIKNMFTQDYMLQALFVKGEVSNCKYHSSGHIYFTLKDSKGTMACVMFAGNRNGLKFTPEFVEMLKEEFKKLETLALTDDEFNWCLSNIYFIPRCYFEWLRGFRFDSSIINISLDEENHLHMKRMLLLQLM